MMASENQSTKNVAGKVGRERLKISVLKPLMVCSESIKLIAMKTISKSVELPFACMEREGQKQRQTQKCEARG
jgi:hypothetical protein